MSSITINDISSITTYPKDYTDYVHQSLQGLHLLKVLDSLTMDVRLRPRSPTHHQQIMDDLLLRMERRFHLANINHDLLN